MDLIHAKNVRKYSLIPVLLKYMKVVILERDPISVNVVKLLEHKMFSEFMKVLTVEEDPYKYKIFVKMFTSSYVQAHKLIHTGQKHCQ